MMDRSFPPETVKCCDNCGRDMIVVVLEDGGFENNDVRDYVYADPGSDPVGHMFICHNCTSILGMVE